LFCGIKARCALHAINREGWIELAVFLGPTYFLAWALTLGEGDPAPPADGKGSQQQGKGAKTWAAALATVPITTEACEVKFTSQKGHPALAVSLGASAHAGEELTALAAKAKGGVLVPLPKKPGYDTDVRVRVHVHAHTAYMHIETKAAGGTTECCSWALPAVSHPSGTHHLGIRQWTPKHAKQARSSIAGTANGGTGIETWLLVS
jgi:hypothetical protein